MEGRQEKKRKENEVRSEKLFLNKVYMCMQITVVILGVYELDMFS